MAKRKTTKSVTFGERLTILRETAGLSKYALAKLAGVNAGYLGDLEAGTKQPGWDVVCKIADALDVSLDAFRSQP